MTVSAVTLLIMQLPQPKRIRIDIAKPPHHITQPQRRPSTRRVHWVGTNEWKCCVTTFRRSIQENEQSEVSCRERKSKPSAIVMHASRQVLRSKLEEWV